MHDENSFVAQLLRDQREALAREDQKYDEDDRAALKAYFKQRSRPAKKTRATTKAAR